MFECQICGLLSIGGTACPACGSQLRTDLAEDMEGGENLPTDVPGLDDAAEAWYDLEGIEPPTEEAGDEPVSAQQEGGSGGLPFGFQGESKVFAPRLPFGIGSSAEGIPFDAGPDLSPAPDDSTVDAVAPPQDSTDQTASVPVPSPPRQQDNAEAGAVPVPPEEHATDAPLTERVAPLEVQPAPQPLATKSTVPFPDRSPTSELPSESPPLMPAPTQSEFAPIVSPLSTSPATESLIASAVQTVPAPGAPASGLSTEPVRLQSARLVQPSPNTPPAETMAAGSAPVFSGVDDLPDYWKIDAAIPNYEEIYDQQDDIVEVEFGSHNEDVVLYDHTTDSPAAVFHTPLEASPSAVVAPSLSLALHPVQALQVDVGGSAELSSALSEGFTMMQQASWSQAARVFQRMAASLPNNPEVFNNYGISLLQRAIGMRDGADSQQHGLADAQFESSILALREAAKGAPSNGDILVNLAIALVESGRAEKALGIMNVHNARSPDSAKGLNTAAVAMFNLGQLSQASETLRKVSGDAVAQANLQKLTPAHRT